MPSSLRPIQSDLGGFLRRPPPATLALMIVTGALSLFTIFDIGGFGTGGRLARLLVFSPSQVLDSWKVWTAFTHLFVNANPTYLLMHEFFGLWMFASPLERQWGARRFLIYFFGTGVGAAVCVTLLGMFASQVRVTGVEGTWVASEAILVGWVLMNWHATAYLLVIPVRAPFFLVVALGMPALNIITGAWASQLAPLAGMGIGYLMLKQSLSPRHAMLRLRAWWIDRQLKRKARHLRVMPPPDKDRDEPKGPKYLN
jgi:membrane associated rhomboid family serine protease